MFTRIGVGPRQRPEAPSITSDIFLVKLRLLPRPIVDLHFYLLDGRSPGSTFDTKAILAADDPGGRGFEQTPPH
jgi:hypothetical protein